MFRFARRRARNVRMQDGALWVLVGIFIVSSSIAQQLSPLTLAEAEKLALAGEPSTEAYFARATALESEAVAARQLPDPSFRAGIANFPIEHGGFTTEGMTQGVLGLRQMLPPAGVRDASSRQFRSLASEMLSSADGRRREVLATARTIWLETFYWVEASRIVAESKPLFSDLLAVTRSLYKVGRKDQQDVLRSELELYRLDDRLIEIERQIAISRARLSQWIGLEEARRPLSVHLPTWPSPPTIDVLLQQLNTHPLLQAAGSRIEARHAAVDVAKGRYKPGVAIDLGYGYRDGVLPNGVPRSDFFSIGVTVDLPFFQKNRQDRRLSSALDETLAAERSKEELARRLAAQLEAEFVRWTDLGHRLDLYDRIILSQARDHAKSTLAAYQSEAGDFADVMRGQIDYLNTRLDYVRIQIDQAQSYAWLANLGGLR